MTKISRLLVLPLLLGALLGGTAGPALAHYVYQGGTVATWGSGYCTNARAEVSHGDGRGYRKADNEAKVDNFYWNFKCTDPRVWPSGYMITQADYYKYNGSSWYLCKDAGWTYSQDSTGKVVQAAREYLPCGRGYYGTRAWSYIKDNGTWNGGSIWSGHHYLPDYS